MGYRLYIIWAVVALLALAGCNQEIGDDCQYDVDCSPNMDRNCDRTQPGGYCLIIGCNSDECPDEAACVEFTTPCPSPEEGLPEEYCKRLEPNRGRTYCLKRCKKNSDCRSAYECADPWDLSAAVIDFDHTNAFVCVPSDDE